MTWINDPLNTFYQPNYNYFDKLWQKGVNLAADVVTATNAIGALAIAPEDMSGITLSQTDPSSIVVALPTAPSNVTITNPTLGSDPSDALILSLLAQIRTALQDRLANPNIDNAIFGRAVDRETALSTASYENYLASQASNGFESAPGQDQFAFVVFEKDKKAKLSEINREVMIFKFDADMKAIEGLQKLEDEAQALYNAQEDVMVKRVNLLNDINKIILEHYQAEIQAYETAGRVTIEQVKLAIEKLNIINGLNSNLTNLALEKIKTLNSYNIGKYNALVEGQKSIGTTLGQLSATMFNTIHFSTSYSQGVSWSGNESVST